MRKLGTDNLVLCKLCGKLLINTGTRSLLDSFSLVDWKVADFQLAEKLADLPQLAYEIA